LKIKAYHRAHAYNPSYSGNREQEDYSSKPSQANKLQDPILKKNNTKRAGTVAQVVEHLPSKCEVLSSYSNVAKKKKERK
jgi:hypothetical protein